MKWQVFEKATDEPVGQKFHNRNGAENYCDGFHPHAPGCYEVRPVDVKPGDLREDDPPSK